MGRAIAECARTTGPREKKYYYLRALPTSSGTNFGGRPVSTITGRLQPYRGEATGRPPKFVPLEVGKARR